MENTVRARKVDIAFIGFIGSVVLLFVSFFLLSYKVMLVSFLVMIVSLGLNVYNRFIGIGSSLSTMLEEHNKDIDNAEGRVKKGTYFMVIPMVGVGVIMIVLLMVVLVYKAF